MSRRHCSSVILCADAIVVVIAALETQTSTSAVSLGRQRRRVAQVDLEVATGRAVERHDVQPVGGQPLGDRRADAARGAGDERLHSAVAWLPARPLSVLS